MSILHNKDPKFLLVESGAIYILGNLGAFFLIRFLIGVNIGLAHLTPWLFLLIPITFVILGVRGGILRNASRFRNAAFVLLALCLLTWLIVLYIYLMNVFPETI